MHNFPSQQTPFIGRTEEIDAISKLLEDPACRLLTLSGPGGMGKTRLAIETASRKIDAFNGVYFVPLQPIKTSGLLVQAIADAIHFSLSGSETPQTQLLNYLRDKKILLVLDNFEQLLSISTDALKEKNESGVKLLNDILQTAPDIKLLITSREIINIQAEWVYAIEGMIYPRSAEVGDIESYSAVQLFVERAQRIRQGFTLTNEQESVVHICQLVEGMPLAIELSASWIKTLDCAEIAAELKRNLNLLATNLRDVPDRHQNIQAVFGHSWRLLDQDEQNVFKRLSIFRGGFPRSAAERGAGATLSILSTLMDKSLLRRDTMGRYQIHELLRQYAEEQLNRIPDELIRAHDLHSAYFASFLDEKMGKMNNGEQKEAALEIALEIENIRDAWQWAVKQEKVKEIHSSIGALLYYCQYQSRYAEGASAFGQAIQSLESHKAGEFRDLTLAELLDAQGWLCLRLGQLEQAKNVLEKSLAIYQRLGVPPAPRMGSDPRTALGVLANILGDYARAISLGEDAYRDGEKREDKWNSIFSLYVLANATLAQGDIQTARGYAQQAYALANEVKDSWFKAYILNDLGSVALALGEYVQAQEYYQASYIIRKEFDDPGGMAEALNYLGKVAVLRNDHVKAKDLYRESQAIYREINDKGGLATTLDGLGVTACAIGDYQSAGEYFSEAIQIAIEMQYHSLMLSISINVSELWLQTGHVKKSVELLTAAFHHPASNGEIKKSAGNLLIQCQSRIQPELFEAARKRGQVIAEEDAFTSLLSDPIVLGQRADESESPLSQALIDPLTSRELDVLRLIAEGLSNKEIAKKLVITLGTVKWFNNQIYNKLNVTNRTQAVARARALNFIP